jgi:NADP-dependent 3-hydroxy acid dehydrogenase YdfG
MIEDRASKPHALVVGSSSGVGQLVAERLVKSHRVTAIARRIDRLAALEAEGASIFQCDVSNLESIPVIVDTAVEAHGKIDCLIYCAGAQLIKPIRALKTSEIKMIVTVNLTAPLVFGKPAYLSLRFRILCHILNRCTTSRTWNHSLCRYQSWN